MRTIYVVPALALGLWAAACSKSSTDAPTASHAAGHAMAVNSGDAAPTSAKLSSPEDNYVAAATKLACLGVEAERADAYTKERTKILTMHAYTEDTWVAASKQYGKSKGEAVVAAMKCAQ